MKIKYKQKSTTVNLDSDNVKEDALFNLDTLTKTLGSRSKVYLKSLIGDLDLDLDSIIAIRSI